MELGIGGFPPGKTLALVAVLPGTRKGSSEIGPVWLSKLLSPTEPLLESKEGCLEESPGSEFRVSCRELPFRTYREFMVRHSRMSTSQPRFSEVDLLMENARLRDALEPFFDESLSLLQLRHMPTQEENEFLASMLAWERAPVLPISQWFEPELQLPSPESLPPAELHRVLWETLDRLYEKRVILDFTDHLNDRQLDCLIARDILPSAEKKLESRKSFLHWYCLDPDEDVELWLRYYASPRERDEWVRETGQGLPASEMPPYPRKMPRRPI
jgi:hypothetical protein